MRKGHAFHVSDSECTLVDNDFKPFLKITLETLKSLGTTQFVLYLYFTKCMPKFVTLLLIL